MTKAIRILQKVLVNYFYMINAGFFFFGFFLLFGLPFSPVAFHLSLISGIIKSQLFIALIMLLWLMYNLKCINYIVKQLHQSRQSFLFCINSLSKRQVYVSMLYAQLLVYMPVLLYSVAIVWLAFRDHQYLSAFEVIVFNIIIVLATPYVYLAAIQKKQLFKGGFSLPAININTRKRFFLFPLYFLLDDRKQMLIVTKTFSLLLLYLFIKLYEPERHDVRPLQLCLLLTAAFHTAIVYEIRLFEQEYLGFVRNLPVSITFNFCKMLALYACLLLPEFLFLLTGLQVHFTPVDFPALALLLVALLCIFHTALLLENNTMEQLVRTVFGILTACFFIILYNPGLLLPSFILLLSFALYSAYFYTVEAKIS